MADNATGLNAQYDGEFFPGIRPWGNRAPGSAGDTPGETAGPVVGSPAVVTSGASSQPAANRPTVAVKSGDTSSMSSDQPAQASVISPGPASGYLSTGAGSGNANPYDHPAGSGRWRTV